MQLMNLMKEKVLLLVLAGMTMVGLGVLTTSCKPTVTPSSPGIATITPTPQTPPVAGNNTVLNAGDIAFVGISTTDNQFAFVVTKSGGIAAGVTINFTNYPWDTASGGAFNLSASTNTRGAVTFVSPTVLPQWSEFAISNASTPAGVSIIQSSGVTTAIAGGGSLTGGFTLNNGEDQVYCYQGTLSSPTTIIAATGVFTENSNFEPGAWGSSPVANTAPVTASSATGWGCLPANLTTNAATTIAFNGYNDGNAKGYFEWVYQCEDTSNSASGLITQINATSTNNNGSAGVTVYNPTATGYTSLGLYSGTTTNGVSIILGNSEGVSASGTSSGQIIGTANTQIGICNEPHSASTSGYTTW